MTIYLPELSLSNLNFPNIEEALDDPDGLLAMGGDLSPERVFNAYRNGIFPWYSDDQPLLWWSPSERATILANHCHISKSMKRFLRHHNYNITVNHVFLDVMQQCALPRKQQEETWITHDMVNAYQALHRLGIAHSIEIWDNEQLVGGLYGICVGSLFCGESMFSLAANTSKLAFIALNQHFAEYGGKVIDCQMMTDHLKTLGVSPVTRNEFQEDLLNLRDDKLKEGCWTKQGLNIKS